VRRRIVRTEGFFFLTHSSRDDVVTKAHDERRIRTARRDVKTDGHGSIDHKLGGWVTNSPTVEGISNSAEDPSGSLDVALSSKYRNTDRSFNCETRPSALFRFWTQMRPLMCNSSSCDPQCHIVRFVSLFHVAPPPPSEEPQCKNENLCFVNRWRGVGGDIDENETSFVGTESIFFVHL
jgi:hypothetical protein